MADTSRDGSLSFDPSAQTFTTPRPTFSTPMTPPLSSPAPSSAKMSASSASAASTSAPPAPPSETPSGSDELGPSASVSVSSSLLSRRTTDAGSSVGADDDDRSIAATSATGDDDAASAVAAAGSSVAPSSSKGGPGSSSSSSVATRDDESIGPSASVRRANVPGRPPVDPQLVEALTGKDRLYVLSVAQDMEGLFGNPSRASLSYSPSTSFHRRIVYQCAAFLGLQTATGEAKAIVVRLPTELYALTSAPYRVINIAPAPQSASNQPPSGFRLMRRDPASSLPISRGASPGGEDGGERASRKKSYEQRQAEYDAARNKIFSARSPSEVSSDVGPNAAGGPSMPAGRVNGGAPTRGLSGDRRAAGRSRASSHASSTDSVPVVFVEPPPSAAAASASGAFIYQSAAGGSQSAYSAPLRPSAPTFDPSMPASATNMLANARSYVAPPVYASVGGHAPAMVKSGSAGGSSPQAMGSSSSSRGSYRSRNARPAAAIGQQQASFGSASSAASTRGAGGSHPGYANQPRLYEPTSQRSQRAPATYGQASDWQVTQQTSPSVLLQQQQQQQPTIVPAQAYYQPQPPPHLAGQAYMFIPFDQPGAAAGRFVAPYGQQAFIAQPPPHQPQGQAYIQTNGHGSPYSAHSYPVTPAGPVLPSSPSAHYLPAAGTAGQVSYYALPAAGSQQAQYAQYRSDGASSAPPFSNGHHPHVHGQPSISYGPGGQPFHVYGVVPPPPPQMAIPQPQHYAVADPALQPWATASSSGGGTGTGTGGGPSVYHRSDSSVSSFGEGSSRPQSRGSSSSRLSFGASSGLSSLRQQPWGSDVGTTSGSRQSWASTSNAGTSNTGTSNAGTSNVGTTSGRSGRRRSSGAGTDRPPSPSSTTSSVSRTRGLSQLAHIPPPKDHPLPPRPDWSVGHQQFDLKRPDGTSTHTPPRLASTNDFPPLAGMGPGVSVQPQLTSPKAGGDGIWSGGRGRAAVLRSTASMPQGDVEQPGSELLSSPDRTIYGLHPAPPFGSPKRAADSGAVREDELFLSAHPARGGPDDDDDFEPRRPIVRSSAALFDPSPAAVLRPSVVTPGDEDGLLRDEERASIEDKLASLNLGLSASEGQGASVIGPGLTYSSIVRRV